MISTQFSGLHTLVRTRGEGVKIPRLCLVFTTYGLIGGEIDKRRQEWRLTRGELKFLDWCSPPMG